MDYRRWKFHKQKTVRLLSRLLYLLTECDAPKDLWNKFDCLYRQWHEIYGLAPLGSEIAALPYKSEFVDIIHDRGRTVTDKKAAKNIQDAFSRYDIFYKE